MWPFSRKAKTVDQIASEIDGQLSGRRVVNANKALQVTTVLACVDAIASGCAVPDMHIMRRLGADQKEKAIDNSVYRILHRRPNEFQTALEFRETLTMHAALKGNGFAVPTRGDDGEVMELLPIHPDHVFIEQPSRYARVYRIVDEFGVVGNFQHDQVFHLRNRSWNMVEGLSAIEYAAEAIGLASDTEANIAALQKNGGKPGGVLKTKSKLSPEAIKRLKELWGKATNGKNAYKTPVIDNDTEYQPLGMTAVDQQVLETRRLQVEEICRAFGVFPQIVMHTDKASTFASAEAFFAAHTRMTVGKWQKNWCEKVDEFILDGSGPLFVEFDNRILDGASLRDTGVYYGKALGAGGSPPWMTQNEVRAERGLPPIEGGDELFKPTNAIIGEENGSLAEEIDALRT